MLERPEILNITTLDNPKYIKTKQVNYKKKGKTFEWEMVETHDSVHVLVDNTDNKTLLFVKQVRIPVLVNNPDTDGEVIECCAGIIDGYVASTPTERARGTARDEIFEELGYIISVYDPKKVATMKSSVGTSGSTNTSFYVEVTNSMFVGQNLGEDEEIEVIELPYDMVEEVLMNSTTDAATLFLVHWWLLNKK